MAASYVALFLATDNKRERKKKRDRERARAHKQKKERNREQTVEIDSIGSKKE